MPRHAFLAALPVLAFSLPALAQLAPIEPSPAIADAAAAAVPAQYQPPPPPGPIPTELPGSGTSYPPPPMGAALNPAAGEPGQGYPPPPPHPVELMPTTTVPSPGFVWIDGHYNWDPTQNNYVWIVGQYMQRPHRGAQWISGRWDLQPAGWVWIDGHWS